MVKKIGSFLLLIIIFLQAGGILLVLKLRQSYVHFSMQHILMSEKSHIREITLTLDDYNNGHIGSGELLYKGNLFDIKSVKIVNGKVELLALFDSKEETILGKIRDFIDGTIQKNKDHPDLLKLIYALQYLYPAGEHAIFIHSLSISKLQSHNYNLNSESQDVSVPPPKTA